MKNRVLYIMSCATVCVGLLCSFSGCKQTSIDENQGTQETVESPIEDTTEESLKESIEQSTSVFEEDDTKPVTVQAILFTPPESFQEVIENSKILYSADYETDCSFISVARMDPDVSMFLMDIDAYGQYLTTVYKEALGIQPVIEIQERTIMTMNGLVALRYKYTIKEGNTTYYQIMEYTIQADYNYQIIFADGSQQQQWEKTFEDVAKTISVVLDENNTSENIQDDNWIVVQEEGFQITMDQQMTKQTQEDDKVVYEMDEVSLQVERLLFTQLQDSLSAESSLQEYAEVKLQESGIEDVLQKDPYGNQVISYKEKENEEAESIVHYVVFQKSADSFWTFQFACPEQLETEYLPKFALWASSISF